MLNYQTTKIQTSQIIRPLKKKRLLLPLLGCLIFEAQALGQTMARMGSHPTTSQWKNFHSQSPTQKTELWRSLDAQRSWITWSWKWQLGWLIDCQQWKSHHCQLTVRLGLESNALVVRAQAAVTLGSIDSDTQNSDSVQILARAFKNPRNYRNNQPLYVQKRILFALNQIGGPEALSVAAGLAQDHPDTQRYWSLVSNARSNHTE